MSEIPARRIVNRIIVISTGSSALDLLLKMYIYEAVGTLIYKIILLSVIIFCRICGWSGSVLMSKLL